MLHEGDLERAEKMIRSLFSNSGGGPLAQQIFTRAAIEKRIEPTALRIARKLLGIRRFYTVSPFDGKKVLMWGPPEESWS